MVLAASPGPGVFATVARSLASGFRPALAVICGIILGDIIFLLLATFGLSMIAQALGDLFLVVKICGGAYLVFWVRQCYNKATREVPPPQTSAFAVLA